MTRLLPEEFFVAPIELHLVVAIIAQANSEEISLWVWFVS